VSAVALGSTAAAAASLAAATEAWGQRGGSGGSVGASAVAAEATAWWRQRQRSRKHGGSAATVAVLTAAIKLRVGGWGGLVMVGLSMDAFIDARVDVLLAGHLSAQIPTHVGDVYT
jgi:hypothetical protein